MSTGTREGYQQRKRQHRQRRLAQSYDMPSGKPPLRDQLSAKRFQIVLMILGLIFVAVVGKLFYIQLVDAKHLKKKAQLSRNQALTLFNRGRIVDRNGMVLAQDTLLYDLFVHPKYFFKMPVDQIATALSPALGMDEGPLLKKLSEPYTTIGVKKNLTKQQMEAIVGVRTSVIALDPKTKKLILDEKGRPISRKVPLPGLDFSKKNVRNYPQGNLAAHVLGYVNDEAGVSSGVEASAAKVLKKKPTDLSNTYLDGRGNLVDLGKLDPKNLVTLPKAKDVKLTIDARLQYVAERELAAGLERTKAKRGTVIMMDPRSGELLAFAVLPTYQPDQFYKAPPVALKNWAISDVYPPGSTFKILTVASGLELGKISKTSRILDTGKIKVGGWTIQNYDYGRHGAPGMIDLNYLLMHSSNIASAKISLMMPVQQQYELLKRIGIGSKTGIDIPGESAGIILPPKSWDESTHASIGYGYGMAATPVQMASAVAAIANGGIWNSPHVMKGSPVTHRRIFSEKTCADMRELLTRSIKEAKTSTVRVEGVDVAGKTGTSRRPSATGRGYSSDVYTSFVGFFPAQSPKVLIMVVVDSPTMAESWGSTVAGPIFRNIAQETVSYLGLNAAKIARRPVASVGLKPAGMPGRSPLPGGIR
ncbi:peptidoglycan D,D-transpeptidase FtsI family protein [Vampirovibrio sp.]|uniref:peptidoglycan D,D-transpeptidase FtsI family protein n=1 Tax=Vampirovibrio sp. TaxID=2717857 RepID=UPI003592FBB5